MSDGLWTASVSNAGSVDGASASAVSPRRPTGFGQTTVAPKVGQNSAKRLLDILFSIWGLILLAPVFVFVAAAIKLESRGPVLFRQTRCGIDGKHFRILKFRTMSVLEDGTEVTQACRQDPRVTLVGGLLRRSSIDELPQLINVLRGEMSLVGPRPHALAHNRYFGNAIPEYALRHRVKPGITGWAQVNNCRGETPTVECMARRVDHDLWYIEHWSIWLDLRIIVLTAFQIVRAPDVY